MKAAKEDRRLNKPPYIADGRAYCAVDGVTYGPFLRLSDARRKYNTGLRAVITRINVRIKNCGNG